MPLDVKMPRLSDNMEAGTIVRWFKQPGDAVRVGEPLAEVETDKADVELESEDAGVVAEILVAEGGSAPVGEVIARLSLGAGEASAKGSAGEERPEPVEESTSSELVVDARSVAETAVEIPSRTETEKATPSSPAEAAVSAGPPRDRPSKISARTTPLAQRLADEGALSLQGVRGSGPGGRIVERDVHALMAKEGATAARRAVRPAEESRDAGDAESIESAAADGPERSGGAASGGGAPGSIEPVSRMRSTIARRMTQAKRDIPHFYVKVEVDMTECMRLRTAIKENGAIPGLTVTHLIVKAVALALGRHPRVNASWREDGTIEIHSSRNIGIAVAVEDGLVVPVLHDTETASLADIAERARQLTERARQGKFAGRDLSGSTISISNVGMLDVDELVAVVNPPHAAVLAVASVKERAVARDGGLAVAKTMHAVLSCDHRVLNGVEGAAFLAELKRVLENPVALLLE